jgi:hypothetical protein
MTNLTYRQLLRDITTIQKDLTRSAQAIAAHTQRISEEATDTSQAAEVISAMGVDKPSVAEARELARLLGGVTDAVTAYTSASDSTVKQAQAAHGQAQDSHAGIDTAISRSTVGSDIYQLKAEWLRQE